MNTTADNCEIVILAKYNNADDTVDFVRRVNIMLPKQVEETMSLYALGQITEEDVCYLLKRDKFYLTEEEAAYVDRLQADYEAWLIKQQIRDYDV